MMKLLSLFAVMMVVSSASYAQTAAVTAINPVTPTVAPATTIPALPSSVTTPAVAATQAPVTLATPTTTSAPAVTSPVTPTAAPVAATTPTTTAPVAATETKPAIASAEAEVDEKLFHFAENDAEKALDAILLLDNESKDLQDFLLQRKWQKQARVEEFTKLFSPKLLDAWVAEDRILAKKFCGEGFDASQGMCGMDYSPVTCEQESNDIYKYKTIEVDDKHAVVTYVWPNIGIVGPTYRFIKDADASWKLDGVKCTPNADSERDFNYTAK